MDREIIRQEISILKIGYYVHMLLFILVVISHFLVLEKLIWLNIYVFYIFYVEIYIILIFTLYPLIILFILLCLTLKEKVIKILEILSGILLIVFIVNGILTSITIYYNTTLMTKYYHDCPFNYNIKDIPYLFLNYYTRNITSKGKKCNYRRCFPINNNNTFICNFNDDEKDNKFIELSLEEENITDILSVYINYCYNYTTFYKCEKNKFNSYKISYDLICPNRQQLSFNNLLSYLFIFANFFSSSLPWLYEFYSFKKILLLLYYERNVIYNHNESLKETNNTSKLDQNSNNPNGSNQQQNNNQSFQRQQTEIIIIENKHNINNINNDNNEERIVNINIHKNKDIQNNDKTSNIINNNVDEDINNNYSKSENHLVNNENKNIFKLMNKRTKSENEEKEKK